MQNKVLMQDQTPNSSRSTFFEIGHRSGMFPTYETLRSKSSFAKVHLMESPKPNPCAVSFVGELSW